MKKATFLIVGAVILLFQVSSILQEIVLPVVSSGRALAMNDFSARTTLRGLVDWHPLINLTSNQFVMWRSDSLVAGIAGFLRVGEVQVYGPYLLVNLVVFWIGACLLLWRMGESWIESVLISGLLASAVAFTFKMDRVLLESLTWVPWLAASLRELRERHALRAYFIVATVFFAVRLALSANQLALPWALLAVVVSLHGMWRDPPPAVFRLALALSILPAIAAMALAPSPPVPAYSSGAHLVPDDGVAGLSRPLVGADLPLQIIDREPLKQGGFLSLSLVLILFSAGRWLLLRRAALGRSYLDNGFNALVMAVAIDVLLPDYLSEIGPLLTLGRIVPGLFQFALGPTAVLMAIVTIFILLASEKRNLSIVTLSMILYLVAQISPVCDDSKRQALVAHFAHSAATASDQSEIIRRENLLASPSYYVINYFGYQILSDWQSYGERIARSLVGSDFRINASINGDARSLARMTDGRDSTRWSPKVGSQRGNEWLELFWPEPVELSGVELMPGKFSADFPRGIKISFQHHCSLEENGSKDYLELARYENWQGSLNFTELGYPYFGAQSEVKVPLPRTVVAQCLLIEQIGESGQFDWSVAEIGIIN